jgi:hypothetical protein
LASSVAEFGIVGSCTLVIVSVPLASRAAAGAPPADGNVMTRLDKSVMARLVRATCRATVSGSGGPDDDGVWYRRRGVNFLVRSPLAVGRISTVRNPEDASIFFLRSEAKQPRGPRVRSTRVPRRSAPCNDNRELA